MNNFDWLKESVNKIEEKVDALDTKLGDQNSTLTKQSIILEEHIKRTALAEENIAILKEELKPIQIHVNNVSFFFKIVGFVATLGSICSGIILVLKFFLNR